MSLGRLFGSTLGLAGPLYLLSLLLGLVPTAVAMLGLASVAGDRPWRIDLLGPDWLNVTAEVISRATRGESLPGLVLVSVGLLLVAPSAALLQMVGYSFLGGGILERLAAGHGSPPPFWPACRRWFWPFVRLGLLGAFVLGLLGVVGAGINWLLGSLVGGDLVFVIQVALTSVALGWLELARAVMVNERQSSTLDALGRATRLGAGPRPLALWLLLALLQGGLLTIAVQPPAVDDPLSFVTVLQALAFGQLLAFLGAWLKVIRLGIALEIARSVKPALVDLTVAAPAERS